MLILGAIIGGGVSSVTKIGLVQIPPFIFSFIRFFIASLVLLPFLRSEKIPKGKDLLILIGVSILPVSNVALFVVGVKLTTASIAVMLYAATPILTALFCAYFISHKMGIKKWFYILIGLIGVLLVILMPFFEKGIPFTGDFTGNILISTGVILWSLYLTYSKKLQKIYSPLIITSFFIFQAALVFFFLSLTEINSLNYWWHNITLSSILSLLYITIPATVLAYLMGQHNIKLVGPVEASLTHFLMPISGYLFAFFLLGERLTTGLIIGTILIFTSIWLTLYKA